MGNLKKSSWNEIVFNGIGTNYFHTKERKKCAFCIFVVLLLVWIYLQWSFSWSQPKNSAVGLCALASFRGTIYIISSIFNLSKCYAIWSVVPNEFICVKISRKIAFDTFFCFLFCRSALNVPQTNETNFQVSKCLKSIYYVFVISPTELWLGPTQKSYLDHDAQSTAWTHLWGMERYCWIYERRFSRSKATQCHGYIYRKCQIGVIKCDKTGSLVLCMVRCSAMNSRWVCV